MNDIIAPIVGIVVLVIFGIFASYLLERYNTRRFGISNLVFLVLAGLIFSSLSFTQAIFNFNNDSIAIFSTVALIIVAFYISFSLRFSDLDSSYKQAMMRFLVFFLLNLVLLTLLCIVLFGNELEDSLGLAAIFSILMTAISHNIGTTKTDKFIGKVQVPSGRLFESVKTEAVLGLPFILLLPFIIAGITQAAIQPMDSLLLQSWSIFYQIIVGISMGVLLGLLIMVVVRSKYSEHLSSIFIAAAALVSYALAEQLGGNGIAAVIALGIFYSSIYLKNRDVIIEHSLAAMFVLEAIAFVMIAFSINVNISFVFLAKTLLLFAAYLAIRFLAVFTVSKFSKDKIKETIFLTLQTPKGLAVVVVMLALSNFAIPGMDNMLSLALYFVLFCHILSLIVTQNADYFILESKAARLRKGAIFEEVEDTIETRLKQKEAKKEKRRLFRRKKK